MSYTTPQSVSTECRRYAKSRMVFNKLNTFINVDLRNLAKEVSLRLSRNSDHSGEELMEMVKDIPVSVLVDVSSIAGYAADKGLGINDVMAISRWSADMADFLTKIRADAGVTYGQASDGFSLAQTNSIVIHRVNSILHDAMVCVFSILERDKRLRFSVKKAANETERIWKDRFVRRRMYIERSAWFTLLDHLRIASDTLSPYLENVYEAIRNDMIRHGMRDVEVLARCAVVILLGRVAGHTYKAFFRDFAEETGVDYSKCFADDDMQPMVGSFTVMMNALGIKTSRDSEGYYDMMHIPDGQRFKWAWDDFMKAIRDDDLMDDAARKAIELNPSVQEEYRHIIEEEERKQIEQQSELLKEKYKVAKAK